MTEKWIRRVRTAIQAAVAALAVFASIQWGPLIDWLHAIGLDTTGLGIISPETGVAIIGLLGVVAGVAAAINQALDKTKIPSLTPPAPVSNANPDTDSNAGEGEQVA